MQVYCFQPDVISYQYDGSEHVWCGHLLSSLSKPVGKKASKFLLQPGKFSTQVISRLAHWAAESYSYIGVASKMYHYEITLYT